MASFGKRLVSPLVVLLALGAIPQALFAQAVTVQQPTFGIAIDADGVLSMKAFSDPSGKLLAKRVAEAKASTPGDLKRWSDLRKVSLVKLERAIAARLKAGKSPDDCMRHLAGLQRAQYVFIYPEERDIVIAGPAEGWVEDLAGRSIGLTTGRPTLLLEDLLVALRAYPPGSQNKPYIGCSIDPRPEGLANLARFQKTIPASIPESQRGAATSRIAGGMRDSLGMANIRVFGASDRTHFAQVLIEADYRMKLIGIGLEPAPVKMATFISALDSPPKKSALLRWWFAPNYDCVKVTEDRLAMELVGEGVQLQGEDKTYGRDGRLLAQAGPPNRASELFTTSFTKKYDNIATKLPVYAQLRNLIDLVVSAAFIRDQDFYGRAEWTPEVMADESQLPVETYANPRQVQCVVNAVWKGSRLLVPASGGISLQPDVSLQNGHLHVDANGDLAGQRQQQAGKLPVDRWWWD
ncbi:MAG: DUF1598 domain-containing protein [Planctomycetales bacterium]